MGKQFELGDILSITTHALVSRRLIGGVYDILNYMTGDNLWTHQLPRAAEECRPHLARQHPQLAAIVAPKFEDEAEVWVWLEEQEAKYGKTFEVEPIPADDHTHKHPLTELQEMAGDKPVVVLTHDHEGGI